jgi:1,2-diacylglycerol 3-beta-glucosyltransferase
VFSWILFILLFLYLIKILWFRTGAQRASRNETFPMTPFISIIVAARNEENNIAACLDAISKIDYPPELHEVIIVNDQSTDRTAEIIRSYQERMPNLLALETVGSVHKLRGKANAMSQAIERSKGEIICTTDADCVVPKDWVKNILRQYAPDVGCICGFTLIKNRNIFTGMQALDWAYLLTIASAGVGWGIPLSAVGNNMSFRRKAYDDVGGYKNVGFSVTEDFILFKAIAFQSSWKIRYPVDPSTLVWSEPCSTLKELFRQKKRWGNGGLDIHPMGFAIMSIGFFMSVALILFPFFCIPWTVWLAGLFGKFAGDALLLHYPLKKLGLLKLMKYFVWYELYYLVYVTLLPFVVFLGGKVVWKDRKL